MSNTGKQIGTSVEEKIVLENPNLFRSGMNFLKKNGQVKYSYGVFK